MTDYSLNWPTGSRDTTRLPGIVPNMDVPEHLLAFLKMDQTPWSDQEVQIEESGLERGESRIRTYRKMYERLGLVYQSSDRIRISHIGWQIDNLLKEMVNPLFNLRITAIDILSRYQLNNPCEEDVYSDSCDVQPFVCFWKAMRQQDNKIHYEEVNRVLFYVMEMKDLDEAISRIRNARKEVGNYSNVDEATLQKLLGNPVIKKSKQPTARIDAWFSSASLLESLCAKSFRWFAIFW